MVLTNIKILLLRKYFFTESNLLKLQAFERPHWALTTDYFFIITVFFSSFLNTYIYRTKYIRSTKNLNEFECNEKCLI